MTTQAIHDPPERCPFCNSHRVGIQEGNIFFDCGTVIKPIKGKQDFILRSETCQKITETLIG